MKKFVLISLLILGVYGIFRYWNILEEGPAAERACLVYRQLGMACRVSPWLKWVEVRGDVYTTLMAQQVRSVFGSKDRKISDELVMDALCLGAARMPLQAMVNSTGDKDAELSIGGGWSLVYQYGNPKLGNALIAWCDFPKSATDGDWHEQAQEMKETLELKNG